ncbi:MAG TPA: hypothetical protein VNK24_05705 [Elusimicrobiota bacterium]|nr:hypothetical protein [Elusimicrobiota bacterium]
MNRRTPLLLLAAVAVAAPRLALAAQTSESRKASADKVFTNDNLQAFIKGSQISVVGAPPAAAAPAGPPAADSPAPARSRRTKSFALSISPWCASGRRLFPTWCPASGEGVDGKEIEVSEGDEVELTLVNDPAWTQGEASFILTAADVIEDCQPDAFGRPKTLPSDEAAKCASFPQFGVSYAVAPGSSRVIRFTADKAGTYKYYDGMSRSGYGVLKVVP